MLPPDPKASAQSFSCLPSDQEGPSAARALRPRVNRVTGLLCRPLTELHWVSQQRTAHHRAPSLLHPCPASGTGIPRSRSSVALLTGSPGQAGAQGRALHLGTAAGRPVCHPHQSLKHVSFDLPSIKKRSKLIKDDRDRSAQRLL